MKIAAVSRSEELDLGGVSSLRFEVKQKNSSGHRHTQMSSRVTSTHTHMHTHMVSLFLFPHLGCVLLLHVARSFSDSFVHSTFILDNVHCLREEKNGSMLLARLLKYVQIHA